ncbi:MAG: helix-turn-helix transcriptional regulator [Lachnospiraceae bacterium]|nr:helix-turn-helix transcriptional regulator [Lachnospiraceae bacterium]
MQLEYEIDKRGIGSRLKNERKRMGCKQEELAQRLGVTSKYISKIENGAQRPSLPFIMKFSDLSGASLDYLLRGRTETETKLQAGRKDFPERSLYDLPEFQNEVSRLGIRQRYVYDEVRKKLLEVLSEPET